MNKNDNTTSIIDNFSVDLNVDDLQLNEIKF